MAKRLIALTYIQTDMGFTRYRPGDTLPAEHPDAAAWIQSGAAVEKPEDYQPTTWTAAKRAAAISGLPGVAVGGEAAMDALVGRVPITQQRRRPPWV